MWRWPVWLAREYSVLSCLHPLQHCYRCKVPHLSCYMGSWNLLMKKKNSSYPKREKQPMWTATSITAGCYLNIQCGRRGATWKVRTLEQLEPASSLENSHIT